MENLPVCRICLSSENVSTNIYDNGLDDVFEKLIGIPLSISTLLPQHMCVYCCALLLKCVKFKQKCINSQNFLDSFVLMAGKLSTDNVEVLRKVNHTSLPYTVTKCTKLIEIQFCCNEIKQEIEDESKTLYGIDDNEPLSTIAEIKCQREMLEIDRLKEENDDLSSLLNDYDGDSFELNDENKLDKRNSKSSKDCFDDAFTTIVVLSKEEQLAEMEARKCSKNYLNCQYKCDICFKGFAKERTFRNHMVKHDPVSGRYGCEVCRVRFPDARSLRSHSLAAHERHYVCKRCGHVDKCAYKASVHQRWHEGHEYTCEACGDTFSKPTSYLTHVRVSHPSTHVCEVCGERFLSEMGLKMHAKRAHTHPQNYTSSLQAVCAHCQLQFNNTTALSKHTEKCRGIRESTGSFCLECGDHFESDELLKQHSVVHEKEYSCNACGRIFRAARSLGRHACASQREKFICHVCGATLSSKNSWTSHLRIHTGEKPFQCTYCQKSFSVHQRLKIHVRRHTGERPLQCARCPKAFLHRAALARHERVHTGVKPYRCPRCHKCFSQSNSCKLHLRTVHMRKQGPANIVSKGKDIENE